MKLYCKKYSLELKHQFTISNSSRSCTPVVIIKVEQDSFYGYGEASLPPYLAENQESVLEFLKTIELKNIYSLTDLNELTDEIELKHPNNYAAKVAFNIALNDLLGKILDKPIYKLYHIEKKCESFITSFTIGIDTEEIIKAKIAQANEFEILKIKLGTEKDKNIINAIREMTDKPLYVDANQGWTDKHYAFEIISWLKEKNVVFVEQPMPKDKIDDSQWLKEKSILPIIADEAFQTLSDLDKIKDAYHGINIKLMKCGGINPALKIIDSAKRKSMKIMLGCMTETSCGISAAIQLAPLADYLDLDGNLLIKNDPFKSNLNNLGKIYLNNSPGLGITEKLKLFQD
jgi:L-Ala-D/L-Glu epimerase